MKRKKLVMFLIKELVVKSFLLVLLTTFCVSFLLHLIPGTSSDLIQKDLPVTRKVGISREQAIIQKETQLYMSQDNLAKLSFLIEKDIDALAKRGEAEPPPSPIANRGGITMPSRKKAKESKVGFLSQYFSWLAGVMLGNFGYSEYYAGQSIARDLKEKVPVTFTLTIASLIISIAIAFFMSLLASIKGNYLSTKIGVSAFYFISCIPAFLLAYIFIICLSSRWEFILAMIALSLGNGIITEMMREMSGTLSSELKSGYITAAMARGLDVTSFLPRRGTVIWHAFRNALIQILPAIGSKLPFILSGAIVLEMVFDLPGMGEMIISGLTQQDNPRVLMVVLLGVCLARLGSFTAELSYFLLSPRYGEEII